MPRRIPYINRRLLYWYYALLLLVCAMGTVLAYQGPLASEAWQCWAGAGAWKRDVLRACVGALLSLFVLSQMEIVGKKELDARDLRRLFPEGLSEWAFFIGLLGIFAFLFLSFGTSFEQELSERSGCGKALELAKTARFRQIWLPYMPYLFYMLGLWIGILWPILHCLLRWIRQDLDWGVTVREELEKHIPRAPKQVEIESAESRFDNLMAAFQSYVVGLKDIAERYLSILVAVIVSLAYEQLTSSKLTATAEAGEAGKVVLWLLLGPALLTFTSIVALGYQRVAQRVELGMKNLVRALTATSDNSELLDRVMAARNELIWDRSPTEFILGVVKSATVAMPLIFAIGGYIASMLTGGSWIEVFVPNAVVQFVKQLYQ
jgi:hypothetical protein